MHIQAKDAKVEYSTDGEHWTEIKQAKAAQASTPQTKPTLVQQHLAELKIKRYNEITATIPALLPANYRKACELYAWIAVSHFGRRGLKRVHWPWLEKPMEPVYRGKHSTRPTAIKGGKTLGRAST